MLRKFLLLICLVSTAALVHAQGNIGHNPLSRQGFGYLSPNNQTRNLGMGSAGSASPTVDEINLQNPAFLWFNRATTLSLNLYSQPNWLSAGEQRQNTGAGGPALLGLTVPVSRKLTMGAVIQPYAQTEYKYDFVAPGPLAGQEVGYGFTGSGDITSTAIMAGYNLGKGWYLGAEAALLTGSINHTQEVVVLPVEGNIRNQLVETTQLRNLLFKTGLGYRKVIDTTKNTYLSLGLSSRLGRSQNLNQRRFEQQLGIPSPSGTIIVSQQEISSGTQKRNFPSELTFGANIGRPLKYNFAFDVDYTNWETLDLDGNRGDYRNAGKIAIGTEWIPNADLPKIYNSTSFRAGISAGLSPYTFDNQQLTDFSVSAGLGIPILRKETRFSKPIINLSATYGVLGNNNAAGFQASYLRLQVGFVLSDNSWFRRFQLD